MDQAISNQTLTERIINAIIQNGGQTEDIQYFNDELVIEIGMQLATKGVRVRTSNPAYIVSPVNDILGSLNKFDWYYDWIMKQQFSFKVENNGGLKIVELIKCKPADTDATLKEIDSLGFIPAPAPYLLGLGVQYPEAVKDMHWIVALDDTNLFLDMHNRPCFLRIYWSARFCLNLMKRTEQFDDDWWFAVIRKEPQHS